jgi:hypothetical protein
MEEIVARKKETTSLISEGAKLGEPVPRAIVDINTASVGVQPQPEFNVQEELSSLRNQLENIKQQLAVATGTVKGGARRAVKQTQATVKLHPISSLMAVAAVVGAFAIVITASRSTPRRSRYDRRLADLRDLYERARDRF